jgi:hypothetical protein
MPYNTETGQYERRSTTIIDSTPDGDSVNAAVAVKNNVGIDDSVTDLNHHNMNGGHYPALSAASASRYLKQSAAGAVSWETGVPIEDAAQSDLSNVTTAAVEAKVTAATILTKIKTVDGSGSGLDADLLDGQHASAFALDGHEHVLADIADAGSAAAEDIGTGDTNVPTVATVKSLSSKAHAPQSIVQAALGSLPSGWAAGECDAPVASMTASGSVVTIATGLQVAYAESGSVRLSALSAATQAVDLSGQADGTYYLAVNMNADGSFATPSFATLRPKVGISRVTAGADLYNPATVTMLDSADAAIRRVYLGFVVKSGGSIASVSCYALGRSCKLPVNSGNNLVVGVLYSNGVPFIIDKLHVKNWIERDGIFCRALDPLYISAFRGVLNDVSGNTIRSKVVGTDAYIISDMIVSNVSTGRWMLEIDRGY